MNKKLASAGLSLLLPLLLAGCLTVPQVPWTGTGERLAACTGKGGPFEQMDIEKWPETYHATVSRVVEAHLKQLGETSSAQITCTAEDYPSMIKASSELQTLAGTLPPWKGKTVSELEFAPVLLEYLRVYECSLLEKGYFIRQGPPAENDPTAAQTAPSDDASGNIGAIEYGTQVKEQLKLIERETASARPILERVLTLAGGLDRFRPLALDVECINRASLDLRNTLGLTAEAAACMPRIWDARGSLRDPVQDSSSSPASEER